MKKRQKIFLLLLIILSVGFTINMNYEKKSVVKAETGGVTNPFYIVDDTRDTFGDTSINLDRITRPVYLKSADSSIVLNSDYSVVWKSNKENIITVSGVGYVAGEACFSAVITSVCPGTATITAQLFDKDGNLVGTDLIDVTVELIIDKPTVSEGVTPGFWGNIYGSDIDAVYLVMNKYKTGTKVNQTFPLNVLTAPDPTMLDWRVADSSVASFAEDEVSNTVTVTSVGAGKTTLEAYKGSVSESVNIIVQPQFSADGMHYDGQELTNAVNLLSTANGTSILYHTANKMDNISWKVYKNTKDVGNIILDTEKNITTNLITLADSSTGAVTVNAKAGTYIIEAFITGAENTKIEHAYATMTVIPNITANTQTQSINVGNTYDLCSAFNVSDLKDYFSNITYDVMNVATIDEGTGVITGKNSGTVVYTLKGKPGVDDVTVKITVIDGIALDRSNAELYMGGSLILSTVKPTGSGSVVWKSSDTSVATVSTTGTVTGISSGKATITATVVINGVTKKATCAILVKESVSSIVLDPVKTTISIGDNAVIKASIKPTNFTNLNITWVSSDTSIATVEDFTNTTATIKGVSGGEVVITAINLDNAIVGSCKVKVVQPIEDLTLNHKALTMDLSVGVVQFLAYWKAGATETGIKWVSTNEEVATIDEKSGLVTLIGSGTTTIIATPTYVYNNERAICTLTVTQSTKGLIFDTSSKTMTAGDTYRITYVINPSDATNKGVVWSSMNTKVATVSSTGLVTAVSSGQTYIIGKTSNGSHTATFAVTVIQDAKGVALDVSTLTMKVGESYYVEATITPETSTETALTWTSKDTGVATVTNDGRVLAVGAGSTIITVKTKKGDVVFLYVTVQESVTGITLNYTEKKLTVGKTFKLNPIFTPTAVSNKEVVWNTSNKSIATVSSAGTVKGKKGGTAIITCTSKDGGYVAVCVVNVKEAVTSIKLNKTSYILGVGKKYTLNAKVKTTSASNQKLKWTSSNTKVATVTSKGKIKAKKIGTATITVYATDGSGAEAECTLRVVRQVTSLRLNKSTVTLIEGKSAKLKATIRPTTATYKKAKWTSADTSVAIVDSSGRITALKAGTTTIKAAARDNSKKASYCVVYVIKAVPATTVTVSQKDMTLVRGGTGNVAVAVQPSNSTDSVTYASDNKSVAMVSSNGRVTAKKAGMATITITTTSGKQTTVNVTVVGLNETSITMEQYDTRTLWVDGVKTGVNWYSLDPSIATVKSGTIVARKSGTTIIYATINGIKLACRVRVKDIS